MRVLGLIPARGGSRRIPNKNLALLGGVPLVLRAVQLARSALLIDDRLVSTDSSEIASICRGISIVVRPARLATDSVPMIEVVRHALETVGLAWDAVCILPPSAPLTLPQDIDGTIRLLKTSGAESAVSVMRMPHAYHPVKSKRLDGERLRPYVEPERGRLTSDDLPPAYVRNCAVYVTRLGVIERGDLISEDCVGYLMPPERSVDINEPIDLQWARFLLETTR